MLKPPYFNFSLLFLCLCFCLFIPLSVVLVSSAWCVNVDMHIPIQRFTTYSQSFNWAIKQTLDNLSVKGCYTFKDWSWTLSVLCHWNLLLGGNLSESLLGYLIVHLICIRAFYFIRLNEILLLWCAPSYFDFINCKVGCVYNKAWFTLQSLLVITNKSRLPLN